MAPHPLPDPVVELVTRRFCVLGEPTRIRLLDQLDAGIVARRREGTAAVYSIADATVYALCEHVCDSLHRQFTGLANLVGGNLE